MKMGTTLGFPLKLAGLALPLSTPRLSFHEASNRWDTNFFFGVAIKKSGSSSSDARIVPAVVKSSG